MGMTDKRVTVVAPNAGGSITTGCHRVGRTRDIKAKMAQINSGYWFHQNLVPFGDKEIFLPFDLHFIKASIAPRAWFNSNGLKDRLNPEGSMVTWRAARVVYDWLGVKEKCAQWYRDGGHDQGEKDKALPTSPTSSFTESRCRIRNRFTRNRGRTCPFTFVESPAR